MESDRFNDDYLNSYFSNQVENGAIADNLGNYDEKVMSGVRGMYDSAEDQNRIKEVIEDIYNVEVYTQENGPFKDDMLPVPSPPEKWAQNPGNWSGPINVTYYASNSPADANVSINIGSSDRNSGFDDVNLAKIDVKYKNSISVKAEWEHKDENRSSHTYWDRKDNITYSSNYDITGDFVSDTIAVERGSRRIQSLFEEDTWDEEYKMFKISKALKQKLLERHLISAQLL